MGEVLGRSRVLIRTVVALRTEILVICGEVWGERPRVEEL